MKQNFRITVMDKRHKGYKRFSHYITAQPQDLINHKLGVFLQYRDWATETFGPGIERDYIGHRPECRWAWTSNDEQGFRIYFRDPQDLNWFILRWTE